jgi:hypothetical protein
MQFRSHLISIYLDALKGFAMQHANKYNNQVVKISHCDKPNICHCEFSSKKHPWLTTEARGLADAEDHNGPFV